MDITMFTVGEQPKEASIKKPLDCQESKPHSSIRRWLRKTGDFALLKTFRKHSDSSLTSKTNKNNSVESVHELESLSKATPAHPARKDSLVEEDTPITKIDDKALSESIANVLRPKTGINTLSPTTAAKSKIQKPAEGALVTQDTMRMIMESNKRRAAGSGQYRGVDKTLGTTVIASHKKPMTRAVTAPANPLRWSQD
ncbi:hypothetical protein PtrSN002B_002587 [Pyrenophora tritici-repentis]|uniref:Uncharacterized protein n=2 Tax=Pyrenophora tritici-repentis TaxID=45151 RepID=A0A2W1G0F5_9PLEO|nr:uncharacterized protein PTRG_07600 [Pyrenophora tritici-repentis Pt-1C-BFP]KAA8617109.1 hypothetical protein PtrV1_10410 [Pyrenophora tritici-repentis]EDU50519.1 predicted protein [Pyrenophora tritici-repentis Pt-1C-BFP]KAF7446391.1 hypothetical protein A1F99_096820 [Pyrenophora tritici-repentis]KAF7567502.1 hypothetical protein PtrM4_140930 [Pyrenophora tritici-repentis]KAG9382090.1 hypothetical protein A1F94_007744 [Pyrenophora tritici-repentis]